MKQILLPILFALIPALAAAEDTLPSPASLPPQVPRSQAEIALSFAPVVKKVAPAVVNIYTRKTVQQRVSPFMDDPLFRQMFGDDFPGSNMGGLTRQRMQGALGSGVIVKPEGVIVTNNHVIQGADQITVVLSDRREFEADVISADKRTDLAILKLRTKGETFPTLGLKDSDDVNVGDLVLAIGNPFGVGQTVTMGIVSATARAADNVGSDVNYFIQTDAAINPGNSGGALVGVDGTLIGIPSSIYSRDGGSLGIGFATPSNLVRAVIANAGSKDGGQRAWLGLTGQNLTAELAKSLGIPRPGGILIKSFNPASPALKAGLQKGDIIMAVNGHEVVDDAALRFRLATVSLNDPVIFQIMHNSEVSNVTLKLTAPPENPPRQETTLKGRNPLAGAKVVNLSPAVAIEQGMDEDATGVLVIGTDYNTPSVMLGLQRGDVVLAINGKDTKTINELQAALAGITNNWRITLKRGPNVITVAVNI